MDSNWISPFWQAFAMPPHSRVCGLRLPPLSVWHVFALEQIGSTYACGGAIEAGDAQQLLMVASQTRRQFLRMFADPKRIRRVQDRIKRVLLRNACKGGGDPVRTCLEYVNQSMRVAGRWQKSGGKPCAVPHSLHVLAAAVKFGIPVAEAWDMPYAQARCLFDVISEQRGDDSIQTAAAQQIDEAMAEKKGAGNG